MSNRNPAYIVAAIDKIAESFNNDCPHADRIRAVINPLRNSTAALATLVSKPNPTDTVALQQKRVASGAEKLKAQTKAVNDELHRVIGNAHTEVQSRIDAKVNLRENSYAAEIRDAFRRMDTGEKMATLKSLVESNSGPELAAIVNAPSLLVGIKPEIQQQFKTHMMRTHCPAEMAEHDAIVKAVGTAQSIIRSANDAAAEFANPSRLAEIEKREAEARAAEAAFNSTIGGTP